MFAHKRLTKRNNIGCGFSQVLFHNITLYYDDDSLKETNVWAGCAAEYRTKTVSCFQSVKDIPKIRQLK